MKKEYLPIDADKIPDVIVEEREHSGKVERVEKPNTEYYAVYLSAPSNEVIALLEANGCDVVRLGKTVMTSIRIDMIKLIDHKLIVARPIDAPVFFGVNE